MTTVIQTQRLFQWNGWTHINHSAGQVFIPLQLLWTWFICLGWSPNHPIKTPSRVEEVHKPEPGDQAEPSSHWPISEPHNTFKFKGKLNREQFISGIKAPIGHGHIMREKYHTDVDLVVNYHCDIYIQNGVSIKVPHSQGQFMVLNTNNGIMSNDHVLYVLKYETFKRIKNSEEMRRIREPKSSIRPIWFEILYRNTWDDDTLSLLNLEKPMNNLLMKGWNTGKGRPIAEIWITLDLQSNPIIRRKKGTKRQPKQVTSQAHL